MADTIYNLLRSFFSEYGYWVIFFGVMLENAGLLIPGETVLLFAAYLSFHGELELSRVMIVASVAAALGDNIGYVLGRTVGPRLLVRYQKSFLGRLLRYEKAQSTFLKHSNWAVFTGRFITGLRVFAGPFAGIFRMPYRRFFFYDSLGAILWGIGISLVGYAIGDWQRIVDFVTRFHRITLGMIAIIVIALVIRARHRRKQGKGDPVALKGKPQDLPRSPADTLEQP